MLTTDEASNELLNALLTHFRDQHLSVKHLQDGYKGPLLSALKQQHSEINDVDFELAIRELESRGLLDTGPLVAHENDPNDAVFVLGLTSKREYAFLTENGYRAARKLANRPHELPPRPPLPDGTLVAIHPDVWAKCGALYSTGAYAEAVEKSFKIVRDRLRILTGYETGADAFGRGRLYVPGASAQHVDEDFNKGVQFLTMAIDRFRNEKAHTSDPNIEDPTRAYQYMTLSSLALSLLKQAEARA